MLGVVDTCVPPSVKKNFLIAKQFISSHGIDFKYERFESYIHVVQLTGELSLGVPGVPGTSRFWQIS